MLKVDFKVVAVSDNANAFGLKQYVLLAQNGLAYKACKNPQFGPSQNETVTIDYKVGPNGFDDATLDFAKAGYEIPERIDDAPRNVIDEVWK